MIYKINRQSFLCLPNSSATSRSFNPFLNSFLCSHMSPRKLSNWRFYLTPHYWTLGDCCKRRWTWVRVIAPSKDPLLWLQETSNRELFITQNHVLRDYKDQVWAFGFVNIGSRGKAALIGNEVSDCVFDVSLLTAFRPHSSRLHLPSIWVNCIRATW